MIIQDYGLVFNESEDAWVKVNSNEMRGWSWEVERVQNEEQTRAVGQPSLRNTLYELIALPKEVAQAAWFLSQPVITSVFHMLVSPLRKVSYYTIYKLPVHD